MAKALPYIGEHAGYPALIVDGQPFVGLGGELKNSSFSSLEYMEEHVWPNLRPLGLNVAILPIAWENIEAEEGNFTFDLLDGLLAQARRENMRLILLWFGLWKNGESMYAPAWAKRDTRRYQRCRHEGGGLSDTISPLCAEGVEADARAFSRLMRHLRETDAQEQTVLMVQVENEMGFLGSERDFSEAANAAFGQRIPEALQSLYETQGDWSEAFGEDAPEFFMAWHYALATERIARAGKAEYALPLYVNTWLEQFPERPGVHPSGGPTARVMPIWKAGAPSLCLIAPDIYDSDFAGVCDAYRRPENPLLIPEARRDPVTASNVFYAIGHYRALVYSPFGIEEFLENDQPKPDSALMEELSSLARAFCCEATAPYLRESYGLLREALPFLLEHWGDMRGFIKKNNHEQGTLLSMRHCDLMLTYAPEETAKPGSAGIVVEAAPNVFYLLGLRFSAEILPRRNSGQQVTLLRLEEGCFREGRWQAGRILNGDERVQTRVGDRAAVIKIEVCLSKIQS